MDVLTVTPQVSNLLRVILIAPESNKRDLMSSLRQILQDVINADFGAGVGRIWNQL